MNSYRFSAKGHPAMSANHANTLELTKDTHLTAQGDCIVGVEADFELSSLKKLLTHDRLALRLESNGEHDELSFTPNKDFDDTCELVIRKSEYVSKRTFGIRANKAAKDLNPRLLKKIKNNLATLTITITPL